MSNLALKSMSCNTHGSCALFIVDQHRGIPPGGTGGSGGSTSVGSIHNTPNTGGGSGGSGSAKGDCVHPGVGGNL